VKPSLPTHRYERESRPDPVERPSPAIAAFSDIAARTSPTQAGRRCGHAADMILHALAGRARRFDELWRRAGWSLWPPRCLVCA